MSEEYGDWGNWFLCFGNSIALSAGLSDMGGRQFPKPRKHKDHKKDPTTAEPLSIPVEAVHKADKELPEFRPAERVSMYLAIAVAIVLWLEEREPLVVLLAFLILYYTTWRVILILSSRWTWLRGKTHGQGAWRLGGLAIAWLLVTGLYGMHVFRHHVGADRPPTLAQIGVLLDERQQKREQTELDTLSSLMKPSAESAPKPSITTPAVAPPASVHEPSYKPSTNAFSIEIENSTLLSDSREWPNGFWVAVQSGVNK
ncbi:MAG TPA: hypothetical protein VFO46_05880, partial [Candidatus Sulfotelmatobacter sp.]|nr:hypothetical protein [Candidatus Sulfotelmatobacter sp.]